MDLTFGPIRLDKQQAYLSLLQRCSQISSDYSYSNIFSWADEYGLQWAWTDDLVWVRQTRPDELLWAPLGHWESTDWLRFFERFTPPGTVFTRIPEKLLEIWKKVAADRIAVIDERRNWDYLYDRLELIELKGNRFHKKKNLLRQFKKKYNYRYLPFGPHLIESAMAMQADWCSWRDCESSSILSAENRSVHKVLSNWDDLQGLTGGVIQVEDLIVAYTIAEQLSPDTIVIHYEKGCPDYKGVYQAINQMFLANLNGNYRWVNREQDLGEEGLRKAKLSYNPVEFLKKFRVTIQ
jgi:hypothetical protein